MTHWKRWFAAACAFVMLAAQPAFAEPIQYRVGPGGDTKDVGASTPLPVYSAVTTAGGCTPYHLAGGSAASTNSTLIAAGAHTLCSITVINTTATIYYLRMYDSVGAPTCSSATGAMHSYPVPASTSGAGIVISFGLGEAYASGLGYCLTGGGTDTDNTSAAVGVYINGSYK